MKKMFILLACLALLCTACTSPGTYEQENNQKEAKITGQAQLARVASIPFELYYNEIFFQAGMNGSGPFWFILDTGCSDSTINEKTAKDLSLHMGPKTDTGALYIGEESVKEASIENICLNIGDIGFQINEGLVARPMDVIERVLGRRVDGVIGRQLFEKYVVEIDSKENKFTLYDAEAYMYEGTGTVIRLAIDGVPYVKASMVMPDSRTIEGVFMVDTGFAGAVSVTGPFSRQNDLYNQIKNTIPGIGTGGAGRSDTSIGRIDGIKIDKYEISKPLMTIYSDSKGVMSRSDISGLIGNEIFKRFKIVFDYSASRMILEPTDSMEDPMENDMSGLFIYAGGDSYDQIIVYGTIPGSPSDQAGIKPGDIIVSIDSVSAGKYSVDELAKMFKCDGKEYRLGLDRNGEVFEVILKLKRLV